MHELAQIGKQEGSIVSRPAFASRLKIVQGEESSGAVVVMKLVFAISDLSIVVHCTPKLRQRKLTVWSTLYGQRMRDTSRRGKHESVQVMRL